jgi:hypothetical protein
MFSALSYFCPFTDPEAPLFASLSSLLAILRRRDDRRSFCSPNHWLVREVHMLPEKNAFYFVKFRKSTFFSNVTALLLLLKKTLKAAASFVDSLICLCYGSGSGPFAGSIFLRFPNPKTFKL